MQLLNCSFAEMAVRELERDTMLHQAVQRQQRQVSLVWASCTQTS